MKDSVECLRKVLGVITGQNSVIVRTDFRAKRMIRDIQAATGEIKPQSSRHMGSKLLLTLHRVGLPQKIVDRLVLGLSKFRNQRD